MIPNPRDSPTAAGRPTLEDLLHRTGGGDRDAFDEVHQRMARRILGLSWRIIGSSTDAEDITQDVLLEIWIKSAEFDPARGSAVTWILGITHHRAVDRIRTAEATRRRDLTYHQHHTYRPAVDDTIERLIATTDAADVSNAVNALSDLRREALTYAFYSDHNHNQASALLGIPLGTYKSRVRDAVNALRATMAESAA